MHLPRRVATRTRLQGLTMKIDSIYAGPEYYRVLDFVGQ